MGHVKSTMALMLLCIFFLLNAPAQAQEADLLSSGFGDDDMVMGACCLNSGNCIFREQLICEVWGGIHFPGVECEGFECPSNCGGGCSTNEVYDCYGHCVPIAWIGDGECDDGQYQHDANTIYLNCEEFGWDGGDCEPPSDIPNSPGACCFRSLTDCDADSTCEVLSQEDCATQGGNFIGFGITCLEGTCECPPGFTSDCSGNCLPIHLLGDGICHENEYFDPPGDAPSFYVDFSCIELGCDGGDCTGKCSGTCCLGDSCQELLSIIDCIEIGGVFIGPEMVCDGIDCSDYLLPVTVARGLNTSSIESNSDLPIFDLANGLTVMASLETADDLSVVAGARLYNSGAIDAAVTLRTDVQTSELPMVATDGTRVAISIDGSIRLYVKDANNQWNLEAAIDSGTTQGLTDLEIESDRIYACWDDQIRVFESQSGLWQETISNQAPSSIKELHASSDDMIIVTDTAIWAYSYPFISTGNFVHVFGTGEGLQAAVDGNTLVVAEAAGYVYGFYNTFLPGQVFIYERNGGSWVQSQTLIALDSQPDDYFGTDISINDGLILVGAPGHDNQGLNTGAAYIYRNLNSNWEASGKIYPRRALAEMSFGNQVVTDGSTVATGWARLSVGTSFGGLSGVQTTSMPQFEWMNADGGSVDNSNNWHPFTPDGNSTVSMSIPVTMPIEADGILPFRTLDIGPSRPEFNLQGGLATLGSGGNGLVKINGTQNFRGSLGVKNGTLRIDGDMSVGSATYRPGGLKIDRTGNLEITGDYSQTKIGEMQIELADRGIPAVEVDGYADIAGTLSITSPSGISSPAVGTSWDLIRYTLDSELGRRFRIAVLPGIGAGKYLRINYTDTLRSSLTISVTVESIDGLLDLAETGDVTVTGAATDVVVADLGSPAGPPDGFDDIALSIDGEPGEVYVFINDGSGGIDSQVTFSAGNRPSSITSGDYDNDGLNDLAVTNLLDDTVVLYLNDGGNIASMSMQVEVSTGIRPVDVTTLDIDGDLDDDLAVSCAGNSVILSGGELDGQVDFFESIIAFRSPLLLKGDVPTGETNGPIEPGELGNSKGGRKLVVTLRSANKVLLLNRGSGLTFDWFIEDEFPVGSDPNAIDVGDINDDGIDDVVVGNIGGGTVSILLGNSNGTLNPESSFAVGDNPRSLTLLDYDGDGDLDLGLVAAPDTFNSAVLVYRNDTQQNSECDVTYSLEQTLEQGMNPVLVASGSLDGDASDDLVSINEGTILRGGEATDMRLSLLSTVEVPDDPGTCYGLGDVQPDGVINIDDLLVIISSWGTSDQDLTGDNLVSIDDLLTVIENWGPCPGR